MVVAMYHCPGRVPSDGNAMLRHVNGIKKGGFWIIYVGLTPYKPALFLHLLGVR